MVKCGVKWTGFSNGVFNYNNNPLKILRLAPGAQPKNLVIWRLELMASLLYYISVQ